MRSFLFFQSVEEEDRRKEREIAEETRKALGKWNPVRNQSACAYRIATEQFREAGVTANRLPTSVKTSDAAVSNARPARPVDQQKSILSNLVHVKKKQKTGDAEQDKVTAQSSSHERKMRDEKDDDETERPRKLSMTDTAAPASTTVLPKDSAIRNLLSAYGDSDDDGDASD